MQILQLLQSLPAQNNITDAVLSHNNLQISKLKPWHQISEHSALSRAKLSVLCISTEVFFVRQNKFTEEDENKEFLAELLSLPSHF